MDYNHVDPKRKPFATYIFKYRSRGTPTIYVLSLIL